jgi:HEAT repeat protein
VTTPVAGSLLLIIIAVSGATARHHSQERTMTETALELIARREPEAIRRGAMMLARSGGDDAVRALLPLLGSRSEEVAECVRRALDGMEEVVPLLLSWWRGADGIARNDALRYAVALSHPGLMELYREAARDGDAWSRRSAAIGLKRQRSTSETFALLALLAADPDRDVRWWAIDSLGIIGGDEAAAILKERREHESDPEMGIFIERALKGDR